MTMLPPRITESCMSAQAEVDELHRLCRELAANIDRVGRLWNFRRHDHGSRSAWNSRAALLIVYRDRRISDPQGRFAAAP